MRIQNITTHFGIKVVFVVTPLTKRTVVSSLSQFEAHRAKWKISNVDINPFAATAFAFDAALTNKRSVRTVKPGTDSGLREARVVKRLTTANAGEFRSRTQMTTLTNRAARATPVWLYAGCPFAWFETKRMVRFAATLTVNHLKRNVESVTNLLKRCN